MPVHFRLLERLTAELAESVTLEELARVVLTGLLEVDDVARVGLAVSQGAGRELGFVSTDEHTFGPHWMRWCTIDGLADVPLARTVRTGEPVYLPDEASMEERFPELAGHLGRLGVRAVASIPLLVDGACLGGILVCWSCPPEMSDRLQGFLGAFAVQVAYALRRGMAYHVQRTVSEELQRAFMPHSFPDLDGLEFGAHHRPGGRNVDVGGDWYDVMPLDDGRVAVSLGDVMGKGVPAAVVMSEVRTAARAYALVDPDPSQVLERLDRLVARSAAEQLVTMAYGVIDRARNEMTIGLAGHLPPLLVPDSGPATLLEGPAGPALGLSAGPWPTMTVKLETGTSVLLYSDGLVETRQRDLLSGIRMLQEAVASLEGRRRNARELCTRVAEALAAEDVGDDVALLAVTAAPARRTAARTFAAAPTAARDARRFVVEVLAGWDVDDEVAERAELCTSELVTNAVIHSGTEPTVTLRDDGSCLLVAVQDQGSHNRVRPGTSATDEVSGRGLSLVQALCSAWNVEQSTDGTLVWCELDLAPTPGLDPGREWDDVAS